MSSYQANKRCRIRHASLNPPLETSYDPTCAVISQDSVSIRQDRYRIELFCCTWLSSAQTHPARKRSHDRISVHGTGPDIQSDIKKEASRRKEASETKRGGLKHSRYKMDGVNNCSNKAPRAGRGGGGGYTVHRSKRDLPCSNTSNM